MGGFKKQIEKWRLNGLKMCQKWSIILWLTCLQRLSAKDRLLRMEVDPGSVLCSHNAESIQHSFFDCSFSRSIWEPILRKFQIQRRADVWDLELNGACGLCRSKSFRSLLFKLALAAGVYYIRMDCNSRVFRGRLTNSCAVLFFFGK